MLLAAKCVVFNWRDSLQKDRMLDLLGVMCRAAASIDLSSSSANTSSPKGGGGSSKPFGHLHIVFRDWNYDGDQVNYAPTQRKKKRDNKGSDETYVRN